MVIMQAKDISTDDLLRYLADHQEYWVMRWELPLPEGTPEKVQMAKVRSLIKRGLSGGCDCGCRADLCITDKGLALIGAKRTHPYNGY